MKNPFSVIARYFNFKSPLTYIGCLGTLFLFSIPLAILVSIGSCVANWDTRHREQFESLKYSCKSSLPDEIRINDKYYLKKSFATEYELEDSKEQTLILLHQNMPHPLAPPRSFVFATTDGNVIKKGNGEFNFWYKAEYLKDNSNKTLIQLDSKTYNLNGNLYNLEEGSSNIINKQDFYTKYKILHNKYKNENNYYLCDINDNTFENIPDFEEYVLISKEILLIDTKDYSGYITLKNDNPLFTKLDINVESYNQLRYDDTRFYVKNDTDKYILKFSDNSPVLYPLNDLLNFNYDRISFCTDDMFIIPDVKGYHFVITENGKNELYPIEDFSIDSTVIAYDRIVSVKQREENTGTFTTIYTLEEY